MKLVLARHGEALDADVDPLRPLSPSGREDVERVAAALERSGLRFARVVHSGKTRAAETAEILARRLAPGLALTVDASIEPDENPLRILERIAHWEEDTLLVGHLPHLPRLAARLLRDPSRGSPLAAFRPGTAMVLERDSSGTWRRISIHDP